MASILNLCMTNNCYYLVDLLLAVFNDFNCSTTILESTTHKSYKGKGSDRADFAKENAYANHNA